MYHSTLQYTRVTWPLVSGYSKEMRFVEKITQKRNCHLISFSFLRLSQEEEEVIEFDVTMGSFYEAELLL